MPCPIQRPGRPPSVLDGLGFEELMRAALAAHTRELLAVAARHSADAAVPAVDVGGAPPVARPPAVGDDADIRKATGCVEVRVEAPRSSCVEPLTDASRLSRASTRSLHDLVLEDRREVQQHGMWPKFLQASGWFMNALVLLSAVTLFVEIELRSEGLRALIAGESRVVAPEPAAELYFFWCEHIVNALFVIDLVVRVATLRKKFFLGIHGVHRFNVLDFLIVVLCSVDLYILRPVSITPRDRARSFRLVRLLRFLRIVRALRVLRVMTSFTKLRILLVTIGNSFMSLFWAIVLVSLIICGVALCLCQMLQAVVEDSSQPLDLRVWVYTWYGSAGRSLWTLFLITFSGGWPGYAQRLVDEVHWSYALFFVVYVWVVVFAITRIITALFLKDTLQAASDDTEMMAGEHRAAKERTCRRLQTLFAMCDKTGDGVITMEEFREVVRLPEAQVYFNALDLNIGEACSLFSMLDSGDGVVDQVEFCEGIVRIKGHARATDVISTMRDCRLILAKCEALKQRLDQIC